MGLNMNRRIFLKTVGATAILIATPVIAKTFKPQWIKLADRPPKIGQHFILSVTQGKEFVKKNPTYKDYRAIYIGMRVDPRLDIHKGTKTLMFQNHLSYTPIYMGLKFPSKYYRVGIYSGISIDRLKRLAEKIKWLKNVKHVRIDKSISHCVHVTGTMYWMPIIDNEYPTTLPPLPKENND